MPSDSGGSSDSGSWQLVNIDLSQFASNLAQPVNTLIKKIANGAGHVYAPVHEVRMAEAEQEARKIRAETQLELAQTIEDELGMSTERAVMMARAIGEKSVKMANRDEIIEKALPNIEEEADPEEMEEDWIMKFLSECELTSDEEMQLAWSKILSGEANSPGSYSKRTIDKLSNLDKRDADIFRSLCKFTIEIDENPYPIITDLDDEIYSNEGIHFENLNHLENIGLISFSPSAGYRCQRPPYSVISNEDLSLTVKYEGESFPIGKVILTSVGEELYSVIEAQAVDGFEQHVRDHLESLTEVQIAELVPTS